MIPYDEIQYYNCKKKNNRKYWQYYDLEKILYIEKTGRFFIKYTIEKSSKYNILSKMSL